MSGKLHKFRAERALISYSLSADIPKKLRGEAAEYLIALKLLEYRIRCERTKKPYTDWLAFPAFKKSAKRTPIQVKSVSLKKHGYQIEIYPKPLALFEGWYLVLIEHKPKDFLLYILSNEMKKEFEKAKLKRNGHLRVSIPNDLSGGWSDYLNPKKFIEAVLLP